MARRIRNVAVIVVLLVVGSLGFFLSRRGHASSPPVRKTGSSQDSSTEPVRANGAVQVEVMHPRTGGLRRVVTQPGSVHAFESADLYAKVSGYLKEQPVDIGARVKEGQVLAVIDDPELEKEVERAAANVERAKAVVTQMQAHVETAKADQEAAEASVVQAAAAVKRDEARRSYHHKQYVRMQELLKLKSIDARLVDEKEDQWLSSESAVDASKANVTTTKAQAVAAKAKIDQALADVKDADAEVLVAKAALAKARVMFEYTKIVSPYDGVVTLRGFHRGDFIRTADDSKTPLLRVQRTDLMRVVVQVPDPDVPFVKVDDPAVMEIEALPGVPFEGKVSRFADSEDHLTRTMRTEIDIPNPEPDGLLRDGMYGGVTIELQSGKGEGALTLPASAIVGKSQDGKGQVYVVKDGKARLTKVQTGQDNGVEVEILKGLSLADNVVYRYNGSIGDGVPVIATEAKLPAPSKSKE